MGRLGETRLNTSPSATTHVLSPIVRSARHRRLRRPRWGTAGHGAEPGRTCSAQRWTAPPAAGPTGAAGRGPRRKLPGTTWPSHIDRGPTGTRAVSGLWERRAGVRIKPEQAPQGASGRGLGWSRGPQVDRRRSTILEQSCDIHTAFLTAMRQFSHGVSNRAFSFLRSDIQFSVGPTVRSYTTNVPTL